MSTAPTPREMNAVVSSRRREKTHSGSTGSAAYFSAITNPASSSAPSAKAPMLCGEFHAQAWPPSSTARMIRLRDAVSRPAPR